VKKIKKTDLPILWQHLARGALLYLPQEEDGVVNFAPWQKGAPVNLDSLNTVVPPKNIVFPQSETYVHFEQQADALAFTPVQEPQGDYILFGVRPCDVAGLAVLDRVFLEDPQDDLYEKRRRGTILALACNEPDQSCFCTTFNLEPGFAPGADIMLWDLGEVLLWQAQSAKGAALTQNMDVYLSEATADETQAAEQLKVTAGAAEAAAVHEQQWELDGVRAVAKEMFAAQIWESLYRRCLGCGICTYLCPTCHCFDIEDFSRGQGGERFRCWDSCMFKDFTLMASGENPRPSRKERVRQRFMHKLSYFPTRHDGLYGCVGCGRCVRRCPVSLDITQVIKEAGGMNCAK
jgi:sulfhydrogenase subunit beta (sulfur reductase)